MDNKYVRDKNMNNEASGKNNRSSRLFYRKNYFSATFLKASQIH